MNLFDFMMMVIRSIFFRFIILISVGRRIVFPLKLSYVSVAFLFLSLLGFHFPFIFICIISFDL